MLLSRRSPSAWNVSLAQRRVNKVAQSATTQIYIPPHSFREFRKPKYFRLDVTRSLSTSSPCLGIPSISANGQIQTPQYQAAVELINSRLAANYPDGRAVYHPKKEPIACPPLPAPEHIGSRFHVPATKGRCSLIEPEAARVFVRGALGLDEKQPKGSKKMREGRVVIEAFPGPGGVTRALLELPRSEVKRVIVLEEELKFLGSGFIWETYDIVKELGLLDDVEVEDWKKGELK
ncbi:unnamed protein product [Rhizoctonia solani]|uniref:rRNA adenine N(6)-methyltransferase n=1 Tax=Rhizoctonia solani TaxID=456999 RepID=A0A8H3E4L8_9AGAM|nr:unnamed protein product [Rhizoctonia solani]